MIETLKDFPLDTVAVRCSGFVTKTDYDQVLVPEIKRALKSNERLRLYYEIGPGFSGISLGAMWEDFSVGIQHLMRWKRIAVVTDVPWIEHTAYIFSFLLPVTTKVFRFAEAGEARAWLTEKTASEPSA